MSHGVTSVVAPAVALFPFFFFVCLAAWKDTIPIAFLSVATLAALVLKAVKPVYMCLAC